MARACPCPAVPHVAAVTRSGSADGGTRGNVADTQCQLPATALDDSAAIQLVPHLWRQYQPRMTQTGPPRAKPAQNMPKPPKITQKRCRPQDAHADGTVRIRCELLVRAGPAVGGQGRLPVSQGHKASGGWQGLGGWHLAVCNVLGDLPDLGLDDAPVGLQAGQHFVHLAGHGWPGPWGRGGGGLASEIRIPAALGNAPRMPLPR